MNKERTAENDAGRMRWLDDRSYEIGNDGLSAEKDAAIAALVRALERAHGREKKKPPTIPIGTRVRVHDSSAGGVGTVVGRDGYGFDGVVVIYDEPAPRGFEDGCCAGVEQCEVLTPTTVTPPGSTEAAR